MPDWFYRTISRPILFRLPAMRGRDLALGVMGRLARLPMGPRIIDLMGHMRPDPRLEMEVMGLTVASPIGLGPAVDGEAAALPALARFGVGFVDIGPVSAMGSDSGRPIERRDDRGAIWFPERRRVLSLAQVRPRVEELARLGVAVLVRVDAASRDPREAARNAKEIIDPLRSRVAAFAVEGAAWTTRDWRTFLDDVSDGSDRPRIMAVWPSDCEGDAGQLAGVAGVLVEGGVSADGGRLTGLPARDSTRTCVRELRTRLGPDMAIIASGGVHEPIDALHLLEDGASAVEIDSGLVFTGPGLVKRTNEAVLWERISRLPAPPSERPAAMSWFWTFLMGVGMLIGSVLALAIASTRVVLPYDESFIGLTRAEIDALNPRLIAFLAHDRVSLAGAMISIGVLYVGLSLGGVRRGAHWAQIAIFASAFTGFASFFAFLGYGYFDPFHAFVTLALLQLLLLAVHAPLGVARPTSAPELRGDAAWLRAQWGQLLLILHSAGLLGAGIVISAIGVTQVFVDEDLAFMQTTRETLQSLHPRLVPLIAHDRSSLGGMLLANGVLFLLTSLWGFRRGAAWLWWSLAIAGIAAYVAAIGVHFTVGYDDPHHLFPAFLGLGVFVFALALSSTFLRRAEVTEIEKERDNKPTVAN